LADLIFWLAVVCCVVAQAAIVRSALRTPVQHPEPGVEVPRPRRAIEIAWTVLPAIGLALVLIMTWRAIHPRAGASQPPIIFERAPRGQ
jgi:heme/copper-type cytochrome/quinol oxidase subunit 2